MTRFSVVLAGLFLVMSIGVVGCGEIGPSPDGGAPAMEIKTYSLDDLPAVGSMMPPLDDGRIQVAPPEGWDILTRRESYIAAFSVSKTGGPPRIILTAEDALSDGIQNVTPDNVKAYATEQANLLSKKQLVEPVKPMVLGNNAWARHVVAATFKTSDGEVQTLTTVVNGRTYTLKLQVYAGSIPKYRDPAYAVAAAIEFVNRRAPATEVPAAEEPATEDTPTE